MPQANRRQFFARLLRDPRHIGAIAPSGPKLARAMAAQVDIAKPGHVVELGPGIGPVTQALLDAGVALDRLVPIERDQALQQALQQRYPDLKVLHGDAAQLGALLKDAGVEQVAVVISSLPLLALPVAVQRAVFEQSFQLIPDGDFIQFTYSPKAPISKERQREFGIEAERVANVWRNVPPASVWRFRSCIRHPNADARGSATEFGQGIAG